MVGESRCRISLHFLGKNEPEKAENEPELRGNEPKKIENEPETNPRLRGGRSKATLTLTLSLEKGEGNARSDYVANGRDLPQTTAASRGLGCRREYDLAASRGLGFRCAQDDRAGAMNERVTLCGGLLLGEAVEGAEAPDEVGAIDADDASVGEEVLQGVERGFVGGWIAIGWQENDVIGDIEIGVAGRETLAAVFDDARHGQLDDAEGSAVLIAHGFQAHEVFLEGRVVDVVGIVLESSHDGGWVHETGEVVDVTIGIIAGDAVAEPEDVGDAEIIAKILLDLRLGELGIAIRVQQNRGGGQERACAIGVDGAALQHDARTEDIETEQLGDPLGDGIVIVVKPVLVAVGVVTPVDDGEIVAAGDEDGAVIAAPGFIGRDAMIEDVRLVFTDGAAGDGFDGVVADINMDRLVRGEGADDLAECGKNLVVAIRETDAIGPGPTEPRGRVGSPFGGHAVAEFARCR